MLIKVESYVDYNTDEIITDGWWLFDDIRKIRKQKYYQQPFNKDYDDYEANVFVLDYGTYLEKSGVSQSGRDVIKLVCRKSSGEEFTVIFDTLAYVLNDEGKTIEKLVANYRIPQKS